MDALSDVLRVVQLTGGVFLESEFTAPWCIQTHMSPEECAPIMAVPDHLVHYHYVIEGSFLVQTGESAPVRVEAGEVVIFPRNDAHLMGSDLDRTPDDSQELIQYVGHTRLAHIDHGGGGPKTRVVCGFLGCEGAAAHLLLSSLPAVLKFDTTVGSASEWMHASFRFAASEGSLAKAGSTTILSKLSEVLFVEAVRRYAETLPDDQTGWLAGLKDPHVGDALALMHARLDRPWTVDELGRKVGMSRSALADRFTRLVGEAPMHYLARWRMQVAAQSLRSSQMPVARIAETVGYESEAAFSRAFKRCYGLPPAAWRRKTEALNAA